MAPERQAWCLSSGSKCLGGRVPHIGDDVKGSLMTVTWFRDDRSLKVEAFNLPSIKGYANRVQLPVESLPRSSPGNSGKGAKDLIFLSCYSLFSAPVSSWSSRLCSVFSLTFSPSLLKKHFSNVPERI